MSTEEEEASMPVEVAFTQALDAEGLPELIEARPTDGNVHLSVDDEHRPILS